MRVVVAIIIVSLLAACGSSGRAPVYERSANPYRRAAESESRIDRPSYYKVRRGDTLYAIAWRYGLDFKTLAKWNAISPPYRIYPGQRLDLEKPRNMPEASETVQTYAVEDRPATPPPAASAPSRPASEPGRSRSPARDTRASDSPPPPSRSEPESSKPTVVAAGPKPQPVSAGPIRWQWPAGGQVVKSFQAGDTSRRGIDIAGKLGEQVKAAAAGEVVYSGSGLVGYGELVIIKHDERFLSAYGHNRKRLVDEGERVAAGQTIAEMGQAGGASPVLHFEIRDNGKPVDPQLHLPRR